jgi:hypothetical protein
VHRFQWSKAVERTWAVEQCGFRWSKIWHNMSGGMWFSEWSKSPLKSQHGRWNNVDFSGTKPIENMERWNNVVSVEQNPLK